MVDAHAAVGDLSAGGHGVLCRAVAVAGRSLEPTTAHQPPTPTHPVPRPCRCPGSRGCAPHHHRGAQGGAWENAILSPAAREVRKAVPGRGRGAERGGWTASAPPPLAPLLHAPKRRCDEHSGRRAHACTYMGATRTWLAFLMPAPMRLLSHMLHAGHTRGRRP